MAKSSKNVQKSTSPPSGAAISCLADLIRDEQNPNKGKKRGQELIQHSLTKLGAGRSIVADRNGRIIAGNKTVEAAVAIGMSKVRVVETDGDEIVVVKRNNLDLLTDPAARELSIADNRASELSLEWDPEHLKFAASEMKVDLSTLGFADADLSRLYPTDAAAGAESVTEAGQASSQVPKLKFGDIEVPLTEDELERLTARYQEHVKETNTSFGFIAALLDHV